MLHLCLVILSIYLLVPFLFGNPSAWQHGFPGEDGRLPRANGHQKPFLSLFLSSNCLIVEVFRRIVDVPSFLSGELLSGGWLCCFYYYNCRVYIVRRTCISSGCDVKRREAAHRFLVK